MGLAVPCGFNPKPESMASFSSRRGAKFKRSLGCRIFRFQAFSILVSGFAVLCLGLLKLKDFEKGCVENDPNQSLHRHPPKSSPLVC